MRFTRLLLLAICTIASACTPTPPSGGGAVTGCAFAPNQTSNDLRLNCTVAGPLPNLRVDPLVAGNAPCGINSWTISSQTVNTPMVAIYGENGDDNNARVRVGVTLGPGTHTGKIGKDNFTNNCTTTTPPLDITTNYAGTHVALVDKGRNPMCVFQSRLVLSSFNQVLSVGIPVDISGMTKNSTQDALQKRIDLEVAKAVNGLLSPASVVGTSGRCNDWQPFTGN